MRPKKPRYLDGILLADNLYLDPRKRPGYFQLKLPDGASRVFPAASVTEANEIAAEALAAFALIGGETPDDGKPTRDMVAFHIPTYIEWMEKNNPKLIPKSQWYNDKCHMKQFARENFTYLRDIVWTGKSDSALHVWWDSLTFHQQHQRMAPFRRWFNWMIGKGLLSKVAYNPFTTEDNLHRLVKKSQPKKKRPALVKDAYRKIRKAAGELGYECLQLAMALSLYTTWREDDVCTLRRKENLRPLDGGHWQLRIVIGKSESQHGAVGATRLEWDTREHPVLKLIIDRMLELCLVNKGCPFLLSHTPKRRAWNERKEHICQVTGERLARMFAEARAHAFPDVEFTKENPGPSFHEVRGLSSTLYKKAGYTEKQIQDLMSHEDVNTTRGYMDLDELPYQKVTMRLPWELFS